MEKSNSNTSLNHGSGDERGNRTDDEKATTSRGDTFSPEQNSHNMKDMKALDFNSADEIRQAMKAILAGKIPPTSFTEEAKNLHDVKLQNSAEPIKINEYVHNQPLRKQEPKPVQGFIKQNLYQRIKNTAQAWACKPTPTIIVNDASKRKRPAAKPQRAGPSKKSKATNMNAMYLGKLSNVARFQPCYGSESDSDVESVMIYY
ncbi:uncharacterized protein LOC113496086 isoform X2 [Trichoplusia ni]|uniref:Uncharacterized protein LOC113496086 isoform X2 n=1 Tax=Trichoplusia ni TaxID=7111 RepID=A0A7E5VS74_TRINI|nr:uncharacterized protein LOC113496086 isoform X2 [Trichoplusia ni]